MYSKCGSLVDAAMVFNRMEYRDTVLYTAFMLGYVENGEEELGLELFSSMGNEGCKQNSRTYTAAVKASAGLAAKEEGSKIDGKLVKLVSLDRGMQLHSQAANEGFCSDVFLLSSLVDMYTKCGSMLDARIVFDKMTTGNVVSWNALVLGYAENEEEELALDMFQAMRLKGYEADGRSFVAALKACINLAAKEEARRIDGKLIKASSLEKGVAIHAEAAKSGCDKDSFVESILVDMYSKCGSMAEAKRVYEGMACHDVVACTALMLGHVENGDGSLSLELYEQMKHQEQQHIADSWTFAAALKACGSLAEKETGQMVNGALVKTQALEKGMAVHLEAAQHSWDCTNIFVGNTLVDMYAKCGSLEDARRTFDRMQHHSVVSWTSLIVGYVENGDAHLGLELFACMQAQGCAPDAPCLVAAFKACSTLAKEDGEEVDGRVVKLKALEHGMAIHSQAGSVELDNIFVSSALVDMYANCGSMVQAKMVFDGAKRSRRSLVLWNTLMLGYAENGEAEATLNLLTAMREEQESCCTPDAQTFAAALKACSSLAWLQPGKRVHEDVCRLGLENDAILEACLVDFYGKCGSMNHSQQVFDSISTTDLVTWNTLIAGYSRQGNSQRVLELFYHSGGEHKLDGISFVFVLAACSHAGLVEQGRKLFQVMRTKYGLHPSADHYHCMVDLHARANQMDEALRILRSMPYEPTTVTWRTLLGACVKWSNVDFGRLAYEALLKLDAQDPAAHTLMARIYAAAEMWEEHARVWEPQASGRA